MRFSVVIPLYNKQYKIKDCLMSVVSQYYRDFEVIIVNDGSTDDSISSVKEIIKDNPQVDIKFLTQENKGVSAARNVGAEHALADYICFLDADDEWKPHFLKKMICLIESFPKADLYCLGHEVYRPGMGKYKPKHGCDNGFRGYVDDFFKASTKGSVAKSSKVCVRKHAFELIGGFPMGEKVGEDLYVWMMLALQGKVACEPHVSATVYQVPDESRRERITSIPYSIKYFSKHSNKKQLTSSARVYLKKIILMHFLAASIKKDYKTGFILWENAFKIFPVSTSFYSITLLLPVRLLMFLKNKRATLGMHEKRVVNAD